MTDQKVEPKNIDELRAYLEALKLRRTALVKELQIIGATLEAIIFKANAQFKTNTGCFEEHVLSVLLEHLNDVRTGLQIAPLDKEITETNKRIKEFNNTTGGEQ